MTRNAETAQLLKKVGAVFRCLEGDTFRSKAYLNAGTVIENLSESIEEIASQDKLDDLPGIGEGIKKYLLEYFAKGKVRHFQAVFKKVPSGMFGLMKIRGVGPKTSYKIAKHFKLVDEASAVSDLKQLIKDNRLGEIEGLKQKSIDRIKKSIISVRVRSNRMLISEAVIIAEEVLEFLNSGTDTLAAESLGSLRRRLATIGDIDIGLSTKNPIASMEHVLSFPKIKSVITSGESTCRIKLISGHEVDIKLSAPQNWGSLLQHYTGSKMHNIKLRTIALEKHLSLSEYGIKKNHRLLSFRNEKDFYGALGMSLIPPELREDKGEIEYALEGKKFNLVEQKDIKGDLHIHTNFQYPSSHDQGESSLSELLETASKLEYEYIGICDHNPKFTDLSESEVSKILSNRNDYISRQIELYENRVKIRTVKLLNGLEVDIGPDGSLALTDKNLEKIDYAIASIHSSFEQSREENTTRIIKALSHPKVKILGHPTGRKLSEKEGIQANWDEIFIFCAKNKKIVEINANPQRLDLPDDLMREASKHGVQFSINTDAHHFSNLDFMRFGVWQARRGWLSAKSIINTRSFEDLLSMLN